MKRMKPSLIRVLFAALLVHGAVAVARADNNAAFPLTFDESKTRARDATFNFSKVDAQTVIKISTGHAQPWPGIDAVAPNQHWDLSGYQHVKVKVRNLGQTAVRVYCRVDNPGADGNKNCITNSVELGPNQTGEITVNLTRKGPRVPGVTLFGMRGYPIDMDSAGTIDPANVTQLVFFVAKPDEDHAFEISQIRGDGEYQIKPDDLENKPFLPFIDAFGQYNHRDWPGKLHSEAEFPARVKDEEADLAKNPGPADWDKFGGWKDGPQLDATGFFRVQKYKDKWTLVDPDGRLFFSNGIDCVGQRDSTPIDERESWFADFPGNLPQFAEFMGKAQGLIGHYAGKRVQAFSFASANLKRKYGQDWAKTYVDVVHRRLRSWGINTIGNWSNQEIELADRTPYVTSVWMDSPKIDGSKGWWGKFKDVFAPQFATELKKQVGPIAAKTANDPWCIGYFVDNEMSWGSDNISLALATLASPEDQPAKKVFIEDLKAKYTTVEALNSVWGTAYASWDALAKDRELGASSIDRARPDLEAFAKHLAETYFKTVRDALHEAAPHHLYLGCRFSDVNPIAAAAAAKYCDVVSFNLYRKSLTQFKNPTNADVPLIVGEFHFGALDRGMFHPGLVWTESQDARAQAYRDYVKSAIERPEFVGCHWFQYGDEPTTGRSLDGENYQIGFVDVADTPYPETVAASREMGAGMYRERFGK